jgi:hypothetical protein
MTKYELTDYFTKEFENNENLYKYYKVTFNSPHALLFNRKGKLKNVIGGIFKFFFTADGILCYTRTKRVGFRVNAYFPYDDIEIERVDNKEKSINRAKLLSNILKKFHANCWDEVKKEISDGIADNNCDKLFPDSNLKPRNITKLFNSTILENIKSAFENNTAYNYHDFKDYRGSRAKREYSVEMRTCEDGVFRAWFSSEYVGCGNGDYYILLNPTEALFVEKD